MRIILTVSFIFFAYSHCRASDEQADTTALMPAVVRLANAGDSLLKSRDSLIREQNSFLFESLLDSLLTLPGGRRLSFAQVKTLSVATSQDKRVRMLTWMVRNEGQGRQTFRYAGYLLYKTVASADYTAIKLKDCGMRDHDSLAFLRIQAPEWVGGICYSIVQNRSSKSTQYLLLNWCPQNEQITRKTAETLQLRDNKAIFGVPLIRAGGKSRGRLVFDYNAQASMTMRYDERMNKVVMDHLSPSDLRPEARNQYQLYGPDLSYDALTPEKGQWILLRDIDVRNR